MQNVLRPYATAGVAIVGASLIAATPTVTPLAYAGVAHNAVTLTAGGDTFGDIAAPFVSAFNEASQNFTNIYNAFFQAPEVDFQQAVANLTGYIQQILDDPSTIPTVTNELQEDVKSVLSALTLLNADTDTVNEVITHTMDGDNGTIPSGHAGIFAQVGGALPPDQAETLGPIVNFLGSPASAILMGAIGPWIAPWVALGNSISDGDDFTTILANTIGAFFNGATLDLDSLLPAINEAGLLPGGMTVGHLDIAFGGLFSPGTVTPSDDYQIEDPDGNVIGEVPTVGGSMFNSIGITLDGLPVIGSLEADSHAVGPLAAWVGGSQALAALLGWGHDFDGKNGGSIPAIPPGSDTDFPSVPDGAFDGGPDSAEALDTLAG